jgi:hypothetical protein
MGTNPEDGFRLPSNSQRLMIMGRTGSGKTQHGAWQLSEAPFDKQPYVIVDFKGDELLNASPKIEQISLTQRLPRHPGLYLVRPRIDEAEQVERFLWRLWERENIGLYIDEGYMIDPRSPALNALYTQGRSKKIPVITLSQRPVRISRFAISEADFYACFFMNSVRDRKVVEDFLPRGTLDKQANLPEFWCQWYDVAKNKLHVLRPVPSADKILARFDERLSYRKRKI